MIGNRIKQVRKLLRLTQNDLAEKLNVTQATYNRYENEVNEPNIRFLHIFVDSYNVNLNWLLTGEGSVFRNDLIDDMAQLAEMVRPEKKLINKDIGIRIKKFRIQKMIPIDQLCADLEVSSLLFQRIEDGEVPAELPLLEKISTLYNIDLNWLISGNGIETITPGVSESYAPYNIYSIGVSGEISAGEPLPAYSSDQEIAIGLNPKDHFCFRVNGNSMHPVIMHGDFVVLKREFSFDDLDGRIIAVRSCDGITIKRLLLDHNNKVSLLIPLNQSYSPIILDSSYFIVGSLKQIIRNF